MPAPTRVHQRLIRKLLLKLQPLIPNGEIFLSPIDVYLDELNVIEPDMLWISPDGKCEIGEKRLIGAPDFIIEILSSGTSRRDKREKFNLY